MPYINAPYINPIRFRQRNLTFSNEEIILHSDFTTQRENYQRGVYATDNLYPNFLINNPLRIEFRSDIHITFSLYVVSPSGTTYIVPKDTWTGAVFSSEKISVFEYTPTTEGIYYFYTYLAITGDIVNYISDMIYVKSNVDKDLIAINYYDRQNRYGGYFFKSASNQIWNPTAYYTGLIRPAKPGDNQSVYQDDNGREIITRSEPQRKSILTLTDIHEDYIDVVKQQSVCDNFYVNRHKYSASDFDFQPNEKNDAINITITLTDQENDYNVKTNS